MHNAWMNEEAKEHIEQKKIEWESEGGETNDLICTVLYHFMEREHEILGDGDERKGMKKVLDVVFGW